MFYVILEIGKDDKGSYFRHKFHVNSEEVDGEKVYGDKAESLYLAWCRENKMREV